MSEPTKRELAEWHKRNAEAQRLVGKFLQIWADVEYALDGVLGAALGLNYGQTVIVAANATLQSKIWIAGAALDQSGLADKKAIATYRSKINNLSNLGGDRNIVAHYSFGPPDTGDGVKFLFYRAKGELELPDIVWTNADFKSRFTKMMASKAALEEIKGVVEGAAKSRRLIDAILASPKANTGGLASLNPLFPLALEFPNSGLLDASDQTAPQTPPSSEE